MNGLIKMLALVALCGMRFVPGTARGALLDVQIPDVLVMTDGAGPVAGSLIVDLSGTGGEQVGGYTFSIEGAAQVGATGSVTITGAGDVADQLLDSANFSLADAETFSIVGDRTDSGTVSAVTGDLLELDFFVGPGTEGIFDVSFLFAPATLPGTEVQDGAGLPISTTFVDGSITVMIPEPTTSLVFLGAGLTLSIRRRRS